MIGGEERREEEEEEEGKGKRRVSTSGPSIALGSVTVCII